jgi:alpha-ribazole phosphatase
MKTITFIRHGQSTANAGGITMAHDAIPLSELGKLQAEMLASALDIAPSRVLVSTYSRTHETALPFCKKVGLTAETHSLLHEFSTIDPILMEGMNGEQRRPMADAYWHAADPAQRMGEQAETFIEFGQRVATFVPALDALPDRTVVFGHGMWIAMLVWKLLGFTSNDSVGMKSFRRFQLGLPMPNCAAYQVQKTVSSAWHVCADEALMRTVLAIEMT